MQAVLERPKVDKQRVVKLKKEKLHRQYPKLWLAKYHHKTTHFEGMQFGSRYRFLIDIYKEAEKYPISCCRKSVQCGVTDFLIVSALDEASKGLRVFYVMPNRDLRNDFVKDRFDTLLKMVPYYSRGIRESFGDSASVGLKHFYKGLINFVGSKSRAEFVSFQADSLYIDEVDRCEQVNLSLAPDRMDASKYKHDRRVGNPSVENWGIDRVYKRSTRGVWMIKCEHCGEWQQLDFFKNVVDRIGEVDYKVRLGSKDNPKFVCLKCERMVDRLSEGEWVHAIQSSIRGYAINQLFSANVTLAMLVGQFFEAIGNETETQIFYNSKLGLPYSSAGSKITFPLLEASSDKVSRYVLSVNDTSKASGLKQVYIGIDVGKYFHMIARQRLPNGMRKMVFIGKYFSPVEVVAAIKAIKPKLVVIDEDPEAHKVEEMKAKLSKLFSCRFQLGTTFLNIKKKADVYKREKRVRIDRTFILDCIKKDFARGLVVNPTNAKDLGNEEAEEYGEYYSHILSSTRIYDTDRGRFVWRESSADHYLLTEAYCKLAEELDDRILDYYSGAVEKYKDKDLYEIEAEAKKGGKGIIPEKDSGGVDIEKLKTMSPESFLNRVFHHTEDLLGKGVKHKKDE